MAAFFLDEHTEIKIEVEPKAAGTNNAYTLRLTFVEDPTTDKAPIMFRATVKGLEKLESTIYSHYGPVMNNHQPDWEEG